MEKFIFLIILLNLLGCQSLVSNEIIESNTGEINSPSTKKYDVSLFSVSISVPQKVKVNEDFTINADFKLESDLDMSITSGDHIFTYIIQDVNGKKMNSYAKVDIGINQTISGGTIISEEYKYKIVEPGIYYVSAVAEFMVYEDNKNELYMIETDQKKIEVVDLN